MDANRICPILNHPLKNGVLVNDDALVKFIQKRNLDFLPTELICSWCKSEVIKLYNKKLKKAKELRKSRMHDSSVSSFRTSKSSSSAASNASSSSIHNVSNNSEPLQQIHANDVSHESATNKSNRSNSSKKLVENGTAAKELIGSKSLTNAGDHNVESASSTSKKIETPVAAKTKDQSIISNKQNGTSKVNVVSVTDTAITLATSISNAHSVLQENRQEQVAAHRDEKNVTFRKKTIKDFLVAQPPAKRVTIVATPQFISTDKNTSITTRSDRQLRVSTDSDSDISLRRLSQEPTTSRAAAGAAANKRPIAAVIDSDDDISVEDDDYNSGTRLPHIQPHPPKRKATRGSLSLADEIMDNYIRDITGG